MGRIALGERRGLERREDVEARALIDALFIRPVPGALRHRHEMRDHAGGDEGRNDQRAAVVEDADLVARLDAARFGVDRIDHQLVGMQRTEPRYIVVGRVRAACSVIAVDLKRILLLERITLPLFSPSFPVALSLKRLVSVPETAFVHCRLTRVNKSAHYGEQLHSL